MYCFLINYCLYYVQNRNMSPLVLVIFLIIATMVYRRKRQLSFDYILPGPKGLPLVGNVFQLDKQRPDLSLVSWAKQFGSIYVIRVFSTPWVIVSGYNEHHDLLVKKGRACGGRPVDFIRQVYLHAPNDLVFCDSSVPQWMPMKSAIIRVMRNTDKMKEFMETIMRTKAAEFVQRISSYKGQEIDIKEDLDEFIFKISIVLLAGKIPKEEEIIVKEMNNLHELVLNHLGTSRSEELNQFPWLRHFGHPVYHKVLQICAVRDKLYDRFIEASKDSYDPHDDGPSIMQGVNQLLDTSSPYYDETISTENARGLFIDLLMAISASTSNFIYALINILLHNPQVLHRLQQEIDTVIGDRQPSVDDQKNTPYVMATIYELLRYTSLVPTLPHKTIEDVVLGGYNIPAGTIVLPLFSRLNHDETYWKNPSKFQPERFLEDEGLLIPQDHPNRRHTIQFGAGTRFCPGEDFAKKRMSLFLTCLAQSFDFQPGSKMTSCDPTFYLPGPALRQPPFSVKLIPRKI